VEKKAITAAQHELREETGIVAGRWLRLFATAVAPGTLDEITTAFVAWDLSFGDSHPDVTEELAIRKVPFAEAVSMALRGSLGHVTSVAAVLAVHSRLLRGELPPDLAVLLSGK